jgi:PAS domain S-box-containing protein
MSPSAPRPVANPAGRIAVTYVVIASVWILASDAVLGRIGTIWPLSQFKGLVFVVVTGAALFDVIRRHHRRLAESEAERHEQARTVELLASRVEALIYRVELTPGPRFAYVSPAVRHILGFDPEEIYADAGLLDRAVHPDDHAVLVGLRSGREPSRVRLRWRHRDGGVVWTENDLTPVIVGDTVMAIEGVARDITPQVWQQAANAALTRLDDAIVTGAAGPGSYRDLADDLATGLDAVGCRLRVRAGRDAAWEVVADTVSGTDTPCVHALNGSRTVEILVAFDAAPRHAAALRRLLREVAERIGAATTHIDRLRRLALMQRAIDASASAVVLADAAGTIQWANAGFEILTGYRRDEAYGRPWHLLRSGHQDEAFYARLRTTLLAGETFAAPMVNRRKDGSLYEAAVAIDPVMDADGHVEAFIGIQRDVTAENAERRRVAQLELAALQRTQEVEQDRALLVQTISHELRTPITVILGTAKTLQRQPPDPEAAARLLPSLERATEELIAKLDLLLTITDDLDYATETVELYDLIRASLDALPDRHDPARVRLFGRHVSWHGPTLLARAALRPLLHNALKFSPEDAPVEVHVVDTPDGIVVSVSDRGPGLPHDFVDPSRLLQQADQTTTRTHGGLGLGLYAAHRAAQRLGASIDLQSAATGTTATLRLPAAAD